MRYYLTSSINSDVPLFSPYSPLIHCTTPSTSASSSLPANIDNAQSSGRKYPAIVHVTVLTGFLLPIVALPYFAMRRRIAPLHRKLGTLEKDIHSLRNDLATAISNQRSTTSKLHSLQTAVSTTLKEHNELRERSNFHAEAERAAVNEYLKNLQGLLHNAQQSRYSITIQPWYPPTKSKWLTSKRLINWFSSDVQTTALHALGMSLAEVAAFMQEIERNLGLETADPNQDRRGIERLRLLALQMQSLSHTSNQSLWPGSALLQYVCTSCREVSNSAYDFVISSILDI